MDDVSCIAFFFDCIDETAEMIREFKIYPVALILKLNDVEGTTY